MLKPLGHRLLIRPDAQPDETESGLLLPQTHDHVPVSGTVTAVGNGPARDVTIRSRVIARCLSIVDELAEMGVKDPQDYRRELERYKADVERFESPIRVGDRVVYPVESGLTLTEDGTTYIVMHEDEVAIVVADEVAA
jgi:co-chaperonin GroES (HSP10)